MRTSLIILLLIFISSCINSNTEGSISEAKSPKHFINYPESPLLDLNFNDSINTISLLNHNFIKEKNIYINIEDSVYVLPFDNSFNEFIFYFTKKNDIKLSNELFNQLNISNVSVNGNSDFAEFLVNETKVPYTFTYFTTNNFIRLHFKKL